MINKCQIIKKKTEEQIVNFLDLETSKITFSKPKPNKYNGSQIGILYEGKTLFVKYEGYTPFGLKENSYKDGNYQGTSMQINCEDKYFKKAKELDQFFINAYHKNKWGLTLSAYNPKNVFRFVKSLHGMRKNAAKIFAIG